MDDNGKVKVEVEGPSNLLRVHSTRVWSHLLARSPISRACLRASTPRPIPRAGRSISGACRLVSGAGKPPSTSSPSFPALLAKHRAMEGEESLVGLRVAR